MSTGTEAAARAAWRRWGANYALWTLCSDCGQFKPCRGQRRVRMLCAECWDVGGELEAEARRERRRLTERARKAAQ